jgi:hypothetical protein
MLMNWGFTHEQRQKNSLEIHRMARVGGQGAKGSQISLYHFLTEAMKKTGKEVKQTRGMAGRGTGSP